MEVVVLYIYNYFFDGQYCESNPHPKFLTNKKNKVWKQSNRECKTQNLKQLKIEDIGLVAHKIHNF